MKNKALNYFGEEEYYEGKIIAVKYFYFESQALLYNAQLKAHGIKSFTSNTNTVTAFPLGNGGIGLHIREVDQEKALHIIEELDYNNLTDPQNISFHEADHEDIAYEKTLHEQKNKTEPLLILFLIICSLIVFRAFMRASGLHLWGDSF